ncbi:MAG TPA: efflux RND transporter periplasmic adaptor subunit [Kofleriaceae bacterium]|nr:efflux RND transporter periplasmic adaptor subunit [Kofleriaceae bacterium]
MRFAWLISPLLICFACGKEERAQGAMGPPPTPEVGVITVQPESVMLSRELPGRTSAYRIAEVRARVNGIVQKRLFTEGSDVKAGQVLFKIDPAPYQAALESAQAQLARAEATAASTKSLSERYTKLIETNAVSRQEYDDAIAKQKSAAAEVAAARAAVKTARINLDYTTVVAPIGGRIGRSAVTEGAYVQQSAATLLATIQQLDPVYVDLTWSSSDLMRMRRALDSGELQTVEGKAKVTVMLEDGGEYPEPGTLEFADASVDPSTGSVTLRAVVPNPKSELLPGMFVRARLAEGTKSNALLVPQRAVLRDQNGRPYALVVDKTGKVDRRQLETERAVGDAWLVTKGLSAGEQIVIDGLQKARPGATVKVVPADASANPADVKVAPASVKQAQAGH